MGILRIRRTKVSKVSKGITLIELLVVIVVIGLLAAIAIPMYTNYMIRARRADAKTALEQLRAAQEMRRAERGGYIINDLAALRTTWGGPEATVGDYTITMPVSTATAYTGQATPTTSRQSSDGWLSIDQDGVKRDQAGKIYPDPQCKWSK
jgi:type IV pilus assembly protein PilE